MTGGAITPGPFVLYPTGASSNEYYSTHEPGHVLQFRLMGTYYLPFIAIPSILTSRMENSENFYIEKTANQLWYWWSGEFNPKNPVYLKN